MTQQSDMQYQHLVRDEDIAIYPVAEDMNAAWNGTGEITSYSGSFDGMDWENAPAFVDVDVGTTDGSRVKFDSLELQVQSSDAYRKPMLSLVGHRGCVGFRPSFSFKNNGWGDVRDASISVQFTGENPDDAERLAQLHQADRRFQQRHRCFRRRPASRKRASTRKSSPASASPASRWTASPSARARSSTRSASARSPISCGATRS